MDGQTIQHEVPTNVEMNNQAPESFFERVVDFKNTHVLRIISLLRKWKKSDLSRFYTFVLATAIMVVNYWLVYQINVVSTTDKVPLSLFICERLFSVLKL